MFEPSRFFSNQKNISRSPGRVICGSFVAVILLGTLLLSLPISTRSGQLTPVLDALFTATSAACVTGLVVYDTYQHWSLFGQGVILGLIQVGGLGLVTLATFFQMTLSRRMGLRRMELARASIGADNFAQVRRLLKTVILGTLAVEAAGACLLAFTFVPRFGLPEGVWVSVFTSVSAFCNAGFDLMGRYGACVSLTGDVSNLMVTVPVLLLIILGGLGFVVWQELIAFLRRRTPLSLHSRIVLRMTAFLIAAGFCGFLLLEWTNPETLGCLPFFARIEAALFHSVSCRTAGFNTISLPGLTDQSKLLSILLMFVGAAPGGTGGGIKVTTVAVLLLTVRSVLRGDSETTAMGFHVKKSSVYKALALIVLALLLVGFSTLLISFGHGGALDPVDILFEETSAFATVGLSSGVTEKLDISGRLILIVNMFLGRVGPVSLAMSLAMRTPSRKEVLPSSQILIG